jgi:hypothetical protein
MDAMDAVNMFEQELTPAVFDYAGSVVPKVDFSVKTAPDEQLLDLDWQLAPVTVRAFRHQLHETSFLEVERTLIHSELGAT